jgi:flagellar hook-associated protein 1 FlgK
MSLTAALNSAIAALRVNQAAVTLVSNNVAHANDPNYTRKTLQTQDIIYGGNLGSSVIVSGYQDAVSVQLRKQVEAQTADSGATDASNEYLARVQDLLGTSADQSALTNLVNGFTSAWQDFQSEPDSAAAQQTIIGAGQQLSSEINTVATGLDQINADAKTDIGQSVDQLNDLLKQLFQVNLQLKTAPANSSATASLTDSRDNLVKQIAQYVDVRTVERDDGSVSLFTSSGLQLLDGAPSLFSYNGTNVTEVDNGNVIDGQLSGGRIHALLDFTQDTSGTNKPVSTDPATSVVQKLQSQLDMMVSALTSTSGTPPSLAAAYNGATTSQRVSASYNTTIQATPSSMQFTTVSLSGTLQTGDVFSVAVNGKTYSYTATDTDKSLDQISAQLASQINTDTTLGVTAVAGTGSLQLVSNGTGQSFSVSTSVNNQVPELASGFFTGTNRYDFQVNSALLDGSLQLKKNSASDVVNALTASNRNFMASGFAATGASYSDMMTGVVSTSITAAKSVSDQAQFNSDTLSMSEQRYQGDVGVNLDDEIANLQIVQNAYAASARLLSVVQDMFDTLQQAVSR